MTTSYLNLWRTDPNSRAGTLRISATVLLVVFLAALCTAPHLIAADNLSNLVSQSAPLLISTVGQALVIITGGLDISVGSVISLTTAICSFTLPAGLQFLLAGVMAVTVGLVNGIGIARLKVHPIIMTLSTMSICQGAALLLRPVPGGTVPGFLTTLVAGSIAGIPNALLWVVIVAGVGYVTLHRTRFGLHLFAIGGSEESARLNGVNVERATLAAYVLCSLFACVAGLFLAARLSAGDATAGNVFSLDSVTAVALGGIRLSGGIGNMIGATIGALLIGLIGNSMNLLNISAFLQTVVKGVLLLAVVCLQPRKNIGL
jgi:ribose transport system permease protein